MDLKRQLENRVRAFARDHGLWIPGEHLLLAVSGGADSLCMLHLIAHLARLESLNLTVAHLHHGMRGAAADEDVEYVASQAGALGTAFLARETDVPGLARERRVGLEEAGRIARREFLDRALKDTGANYVATAHTQSDHVETVLLHLCRGAGLHGLVGIPPRGFGQRIRPLLPLTREETRAFCKEQGLEPREDPANEDLAFARNRMRSKVLPLLREQINPSIDQALVRMAAVAAGAVELVEQEGRRLLQNASTTTPEMYRRKVLRAGAPAAAAQAIRFALASLRETPEDVTFSEVERITGLLQSGGKAPLNGGWLAEVSGDMLRFSKREFEEVVASEAPILPIPVPGEVLLPRGGTLVASFTRPAGTEDNVIDQVTAKGVLRVRYPLPGDAIVPAGHRTPRKLKDLFLRQRIPVWQRVAWPVILDDAGILCVPGIAHEDRPGLQDERSAGIWISWKRENESRG